MNAIKIRIKKAEGEHDPGASKFFGSPVIPGEWLNFFAEDIIFFAQLRLSDIAALDTENNRDVPVSGDGVLLRRRAEHRR